MVMAWRMQLVWPLLLLAWGGHVAVLSQSLNWPPCGQLVTSECRLPSVISGDASFTGSYNPVGALMPGLSPAVEVAEDLSWAPGASLTLQTLVAVQQGDTLALGRLPSGNSLHMTSVRILASRAAFAAYNASYWASRATAPPNATVYTDNATFFHVNWGGYPNYQQLSARGVALLANDDIGNEARLRTSLVNVSDSAGPLNYVAGATQDTLVPYLRELGSIVTPVPLLVYITTNITLTRAMAGPGGIPINRPVILAGRVNRKTSIDFRMEVNQFNLTASPYSNLTLDSLVLENLAYGDATSAAYSSASSLSITNALWSVLFNRAQVRLIVRNCTFVLASQAELDYITYWSTVYNSPLPYFQSQALYGSLRATVKAWDVVATGNPNSLILVKVLGRALWVYDTLTTTTPQVAPPLALPPNDAINSPLTANQQPPVVLSVDSLQKFVGMLSAPMPALSPGERPTLTTILLLTQNMSWAPGLISNWPPPGGLPINSPQRVTGTPPADGRRWTGALQVDLGYGQNMLKISDTILQPGMLEFTLMQLTGLAQGPNAATARSLLPDVFTLLLWSVQRPPGIPGSIVMRNVTLRLPKQELDYIRSQAERSSVFGIQPEGDSTSTLAFINVTIVDDNQLWVSSMDGYGITASRLRLLTSTDAPAADYRWPFDPEVSGSGDSGLAGWLVAIIVVLSVLGAVALAVLGLIVLRRRALAAGPAEHDAELGADDKPPESPKCPCPPTHLRKLSDVLLRPLGGSGSGNLMTTNSSSGNARITVETGPSSVSASSRSKSYDVEAGPDSDRQRGSGGQRSARRNSNAQKGIAEDTPFGGDAGAAAAAAAIGSSGRAGASVASDDMAVQHSGPSLIEHTWRRLNKAISNVSQDLQRRRVEAMLPGQQASTLTQRSSLERASSTAPAASGSLSSSSNPARQSSQGSGTAGSSSTIQQLQLFEVLGNGNFGAVYRGLWRGTPVAVKVMQLPASSLGNMQSDVLAQQHMQQAAMAAAAGGGGALPVKPVREHMAVREAAISISAAVSHPNIVQVYTYTVRPITLENSEEAAKTDSSNSAEGEAGGLATVQSLPPVVAWELRLVMELCDQGSLRSVLDNHQLHDLATNRPHHATVLALALDVAYAMLHLHSESILHGDLKCSNVLLKQALSVQTPRGALAAVQSGAALTGGLSAGGNVTGIATGVPGARLVAKVADFGLSLMMDPTASHVSHMHAGTLTHMAPELLTHGHASKASDVYAFGVLLWELATAGRAFAGTPRALLGHQIVQERRRPAWPLVLGSPFGSGADGALNSDSSSEARYRALVERCWAHEPADRPTFEQVVEELSSLLEELAQQQIQQQVQEMQRTAAADEGADGAGSHAGVDATTLLPYYRPAAGFRQTTAATAATAAAAPTEAAAARAAGAGAGAAAGGGAQIGGATDMARSVSAAGGGLTADTGLSYSGLARVVAEIMAAERGEGGSETNTHLEQDMRHSLQHADGSTVAAAGGAGAGPSGVAQPGDLDSSIAQTL